MVTESTGVVLYYIYLEVIAIRCFAVSTKILLLIFSGDTKNKENITLVHKRKSQKRQNHEY